MRSSRALAVLVLLGGCASDRDGPTPAITQVTPNLICNAQLPATLVLTGSGFSPAVIDALGDTPSVVMPRVVWTGGNTSYEVTTENVTLPGGDRTGTKLQTLIPVGSLPPATSDAAAVMYDVTVTNANENVGTLAKALTVVPPPTLSSIQPNSGAQGTMVSFTVMGLAFREGMTITLDAVPAVAATGVTVTSPTTATGTFDLTNVMAGVYDVTIRNVEGCTFTLRMAFTVFVPKIIQVSGIDPPFGCTCSTTTVTITSNNGDFRSTPVVELRATGMATATPQLLQRVAFVDEHTLTAVVPAGIPVGNYDVTVRNPPYDGGIGTLTAGFRVVANPVPIVTTTEPPGATTQETPTVKILGMNFRSTVKVELIGAASPTPVFTRAGIAPVSPTEVDLTIPASTIATAPYLVRVWNEDEQTYFTFSSFLITNPSGKLNTFETLAPQLVAGRRLLAGASADDALGNHYVYAIGGETGSTLLDTVEVSQLARFGNLGAWKSIDRNKLTVPRTGASAVTFTTTAGTSYVYVIGGRTSGGAPILGSVERATVLSPDDAPVITATTTVTTGGTIGAGSWYYKVAAVLPAGDADNPGGETLASDEEIVTIGASGTITLTWSAVPTAVSYRIYRTDEVNGRSQQEHLIGTSTTTGFTDAGAAAGTEAFLPDGALGTWKVVGGALGNARWGHQAVLVRDTAGAAHVVVLGGKTAVMGGVTASVEHAAFDAATGALGNFSGGTALPAPRAFFWAALETQGNSKLKPPTPGRIFVTAGISAASATLDSIVFSDVGAAGANGAWGTLSKTTNSNVGGPMSVITNNTIFVMGGAGNVTDGATGPTFSGVTVDGRQMIFDNNGAEGSSISSTSSSLLAPRAFGVVVRGAGFIYFIGGTQNGSNVVRTVEKTF